MADLGETSGANTAHKHLMTSWITVILIILGMVALAFAFVLQSIPLAVVGGVLTVAGAVCGFVFRIIDDAH